MPRRFVHRKKSLARSFPGWNYTLITEADERRPPYGLLKSRLEIDGKASVNFLTFFFINLGPGFYKPGATIQLRLEDRASAGASDGLTARGHAVERIATYLLGSIQGILMNLETATMTAGADPRRAAQAVGY